MESSHFRIPQRVPQRSASNSDSEASRKDGKRHLVEWANRTPISGIGMKTTGSGTSASMSPIPGRVTVIKAEG